MTKPKPPKFWVCRDKIEPINDNNESDPYRPNGRYSLYRNHKPMRMRDFNVHGRWQFAYHYYSREEFYEISKIRLRPSGMKRNPVRIKIW